LPRRIDLRGSAFRSWSVYFDLSPRGIGHSPPLRGEISLINPRLAVKFLETTALIK
jgi:hypothetical protein